MNFPTDSAHTLPSQSPSKPSKLILLRRPSSHSATPRNPSTTSSSLSSHSEILVKRVRALSLDGEKPVAFSKAVLVGGERAEEEGSAEVEGAAAESEVLSLAEKLESIFPPSTSATATLESATPSQPVPGTVLDSTSSAIPPLDPVLVTAMSHPRDRLLLIKVEIELEKFVRDETKTHLPLSSSSFPPNLNSYHRLLIHRLSDLFNIVRTIEPTLPGDPPGSVILVKSPTTAIPPRRIVSYVPTPLPIPPILAPPFTPSFTPPTAPASTPSSLLSPSPSPSPSASSHRQFKILPRHSHHHSSASSSTSTSISTGTDSPRSSRAGGTGGGVSNDSRKEMTLEERELAYKEARERIFAVAHSEAGDGGNGLLGGGGVTRPSSAGSSYSRTSGGVGREEGFGGGGYESAAGRYAGGGLRPSAPVFDPTSSASGGGGGGEYRSYTPYPYAPTPPLPFTFPPSSSSNLNSTPPSTYPTPPDSSSSGPHYPPSEQPPSNWIQTPRQASTWPSRPAPPAPSSSSGSSSSGYLMRFVERERERETTTTATKIHHPSLPAKPTWVATQPPIENNRRTLANSAPVTPSPLEHPFPSTSTLGRNGGYGNRLGETMGYNSVSTGSIPGLVGGGNTFGHHHILSLPSTNYFQPPPQQQPISNYPQQQQQQYRIPPPPQPFYPQQQQPPQQPLYPQQQPTTFYPQQQWWGDPNLPLPPHFLPPPPSVPVVLEPQEMRRPPARNRELFDPNKPKDLEGLRLS